MARLHILHRTDNEVLVVAHVLTPTGNNDVGVPWSLAVQNSGLYGVTILRDGDGTGGTIDAVEKAQLVSGALVEVTTTLRPQTAQEPINDYLDGVFTPIRTDTQDKLRDRLRHFGKTRGTN